MSRYRLAAAVESDLEAIWQYITEHNEDAADQWLARFFDAFKKIAESPGIGHTRRDLTHQPIRFWPVQAYLILCRQQNEYVEIIAVTHGARDIPAFLRYR